MPAPAPHSESAPGNALGEALRTLCQWQRLAREGGRWLEGALAGHAVAGSEFLLAWLVGSEMSAGQPQQALAEAAGLSAAQTSVCLEKLRLAGWLESRRAPHDRRQQLWHLTPRGNECLAAVMQHLAARLINKNREPVLRVFDPANPTALFPTGPATRAEETPT